ncbi:MAG TPA: hypothetical protein VFU19_18690 [Iamia sp.]|nr:hypothetical protein [Iamia sp.]
MRYATADAPDMTVAAPYAALLGWLHDPPTLLGHLMHHGHRVDGSLAALSAVEGVVSSAPVGAAPSPADRAAWVAEMSSSPDEGLASGVTTVAVTVVTLEEGEGEDVLA